MPQLLRGFSVGEICYPGKTKRPPAMAYPTDRRRPPEWPPMMHYLTKTQIVMNRLAGKKIALLSETGFEEAELTNPKTALEREEAEVILISPAPAGKVRGWKDGNWSIALVVDVAIDEALPDDYDALLIPGGVINPDKLRRSRGAIDFARSFLKAGKPVAAICHGPQLLIETKLLEGVKLTSFYSIKTDLINAGAHWVDKEVVTDRGIVTSRSPADLEAFNRKIVEEVGEGIHDRDLISRESTEDNRGGL